MLCWHAWCGRQDCHAAHGVLAFTVYLLMGMFIAAFAVLHLQTGPRCVTARMTGLALFGVTHFSSMPSCCPCAICSGGCKTQELQPMADHRPRVRQGGDAKDALLGRVFAYAAVARSGRLGGRGVGAADAARVAGALVDAMRRKSFLREVTHGFEMMHVYPHMGLELWPADARRASAAR